MRAVVQTKESVMSGTAPHLDREFWRPPVPGTAISAAPHRTEVCRRCNSEFVVGSRFCHVCGAEREPDSPATSSGLARRLEWHFIREALGLNVAALIAFVMGLACVALAVGTGLVYAAATLTDWQAVQIWRIEWLLAAAVAFLVGTLLKRAG